MNWKEAWWIRPSREQILQQNILLDEDNNHFMYARCSFFLETTGSLDMLITANSRYRLYVNEEPVLSGPCKGDQYRHYYDEINVSRYLKPGKNVLAVQILYCDWTRADDLNQPFASIIGVSSPAVGHRLCVEGMVRDEEGNPLADITTGKADWKFYFEKNHQLVSAPVNVNYGAITEDVDYSMICRGWKKADFDDSSWWQPEAVHTARETDFEQAVGQIHKLRLFQRPIPLLAETPGTLTEQLEKSQEVWIGEDGGREFLRILPHQKKQITFHAGTLMSAYMNFHMSGGKGARISFTYIERFMDRDREIPVKEWQPISLTEEGRENLQQDTILLNGDEITCQPFWMRTFRVLQITIENQGEELLFYRPGYRQTHYPLTVVREPDFSSMGESGGWKKRLFDICVNTLKNCMMDTYMDCPYYEQEQFIMDTRLQALFTYCISDDDSLAAKALEDFHCSMRPDGLICGKYPAAFTQVISTFSLYYIYMVWEHYLQTKDLSVLKKYRADCDRILEYYDSHLADNGMVGNPGYWPFVDWKDQWEWGVPNHKLQVPSATISFQYAYALLTGAKIAETSGRRGLAEEYRAREKALFDAVYRACWNPERQLYREGPGLDTYSQHAQSWAVVTAFTEEIPGEDSFLQPDQDPAEIMKHAVYDKDMITCTFAASYEFYRALDLTGMAIEKEFLLGKWKPLLDRDVTTCPEVPVGGRSACHAWSALPVYMLFHSGSGQISD